MTIISVVYDLFSKIFTFKRTRLVKLRIEYVRIFSLIGILDKRDVKYCLACFDDMTTDEFFALTEVEVNDIVQVKRLSTLINELIYKYKTVDATFVKERTAFLVKKLNDAHIPISEQADVLDKLVLNGINHTNYHKLDQRDLKAVLSIGLSMSL